MEEIKFSKLKGRMVELGITGQKLAQLLNLSESSIYKKLSGEKEFKHSEIKKICEILKISNSELAQYFFN